MTLAGPAWWLVAGGWRIVTSTGRMVHTVDTVTTSYMLRSEDWGWGVSAVKNMITVATSIQQSAELRTLNHPRRFCWLLLLALAATRNAPPVLPR